MDRSTHPWGHAHTLQMGVGAPACWNMALACL